MSDTNKKLYIKSVHISGFRSYADAQVSKLSPHCNVVLGPNGSGKSNFFAALEFVLGEREFSNLSHEDRQELLHEGGSEALSAYVEVVFDNSEGRLQLDSEEVVLRRSVGVKKDEFFVNRKHVSKQDVATLLEGAGFSRSNPYYICRQGKVSELCTMSDSARLELLKEVAGTTVYDSRRKDSELLLEEAKAKTTKINESISSISSRLSELQQEKEELEEFRELDQAKRALDFLLSDGEIHQNEQELERLESQRLERLKETTELRKEAERLQEELDQLENQISFAQLELSRWEQAKGDLEAKLLALGKSKTRKELDVRDAEERSRTKRDRISQVKHEFKLVEEDIASCTTKKTALQVKAEEASHSLAQCREELDRLTKREEEIRSKQGRNARFGDNVEERNMWLDEEIAGLQSALEAKKQAHDEFQHQVDSMQAESLGMEQELALVETSLLENEQAISASQAAMKKTREAREVTNAKRKDLWKRVQVEEDKSRVLEEDLKKATRNLADICPLSFMSGLRALEEIQKELGLSSEHHVFGPLYSLVTCSNPAFRTALEVASGNQLLHVVVDTDSTAALLMERLLEKKAGRITFKPLNVLLQREQQQQQRSKRTTDEDNDDDDGPTTTSSSLEELKSKLAQQKNPDDAFPLIDKVVFEDKFAPAVRAMVGNTLVCRNHQVASVCSKKFQVDCVTLEGDQVSRRGALSGGFVDTKRSRLLLSAEVSRCTQAFSKLSEELANAKSQARVVDQQATQLSGEMDKLDTSLKHLMQTQVQLKQSRSRCVKSLQTIKDALEALTGQHETVKSIAHLQHRMEELEVEKKEPLGELLKPEERTELQELPLQIEKLVLEERTRSNAEAQLKSELFELKTELEENLLRRKEELLQQQQQQQQQAAFEDDAISNKSDLALVIQEEEELKEEMDALHTRIAETRKEFAAWQQTLVKQRERECELGSALNSKENEMEALLERRDEHVLKRERAARRIREIGNLPPSELEKYKKLPNLSGQLSKVNAQLKQFSSVNKKALEQFVSFSEQKQALALRQKEAHEADTKIRDLIQHLDRVKDEAILLTFKHVAHNFREIFSELVPHGVAELRMVKGRMDDDAENSNDDEEEEDNAGSKPQQVKSFVGVSPRVSFTGAKETVSMKQLSGGQKALVALTLMFAIQRSDQAPFYLFDEIDQALDSNHRTAVANLIQRQAKSKTRSAQFIITTFRPEMVMVADKCFGIQFSQKVSSVGLIDKEQALRFIRLASVEGTQVVEDGDLVPSSTGKEHEEEEEESDERPRRPRRSKAPAKRLSQATTTTTTSSSKKGRRTSKILPSSSSSSSEDDDDN